MSRSPVRADVQRGKLVRASRSNADLEQFAYVASHDLQEPLRMVGNFTRLLQRRYQGALDDKADRYIHFTVDGVKRMQRLLNELLEYARVDRASAALEPVDTALACREAVAGLAGTIREADAVVEVERLPVVHGDGRQIAQLFQNLIGNALKFRSRDRAFRVTVTVEDGDTEWCYAVRDNGIGIDPEALERIFVMFWPACLTGSRRRDLVRYAG